MSSIFQSAVVTAEREIISFLLVAAEDALTTAITFSALIAIMFIGIGLQKKESGSGKKALGKIRKALGGS